MSIEVLNGNNFDNLVNRASELLKTGEVLLVPFDTVYGFIADAKNNEAVEKIYELKGRNFNKPLGVAVDDIGGMESWLDLSSANYRFMASRVPGKYTFIVSVNENPGISPHCIHNHTIGIRVPDNILVRAIAAKSGMILAQTSANKSGQPNCSDIGCIVDQFSEEELKKISLIIDGGGITESKVSQIFDLTGDEPKPIERK